MGKMGVAVSKKQSLTLEEYGTATPGDIPGYVSHHWRGVLDDAACLRLLLRLHYPSGPRCPRCGSADINTSSERFWSGGRFTCRACRQKSSPTRGTILRGNLTAGQIVTLAALLSFGVGHTVIAAAAGVKSETVRAWRDKFAALAEIEHS
jgi:transposase-like protein